MTEKIICLSKLYPCSDSNISLTNVFDCSLENIL